MTVSDSGVRRIGSTAPVLPFVDALRRLCVSIDEEAELRTADVEVFRRSLLRHQTVLADAESALATRPQLSDVDLGRPVFIVGFLRTGTTLLQNLLSRHEDLYAPPLWELLSPVETSTGSKAVHTRLQTMTSSLRRGLLPTCSPDSRHPRRRRRRAGRMPPDAGGHVPQHDLRAGLPRSQLR